MINSFLKKYYKINILILLFKKIKIIKKNIIIIIHKNKEKMINLLK